MANVLDCDYAVSEFERQLRYNVHFRIPLTQILTPLSTQAMG